MFANLAKKIFGSANERRLKSYETRIKAINAVEATVQALSDEALKARTDQFRARLAQDETLDDILVEAFATVHEAAKRVLGQRHFDVQLIGGMVLHDGAIAEMRTGEGKTLVATLPAYLNALSGKGVHVVTVNDYLARRDAAWMGQIYQFLGLSVGVIVNGISDDERKAAYEADITYGTNNEFGFDYLRDNMKYDMRELTQRGHNFAIVDEVDSILIDEARTPLIISGPSDDKSELYQHINELIPLLVAEDYEIDEKQRSVNLTEAGNEHCEVLLNERNALGGASLYDAENITTLHHINQALRAHKLFVRDKDYIVRKGEVIIIDEFTGRMMPGRRYSEGLHQAIEAKEHVEVQPENVTLASITFQNYFRLYQKLAGMTGTALTEADEFAEIYKLDVVEIPTNQKVLRKDEDDEVYRTEAEKQKAILNEIKAANEKLQPVLVGTTSIEKSEELAAFLKKSGYTQIDFDKPAGLQKLYEAARKNVPSKLFAVLNARFHEQEAVIVAEAGVPGAITIATNMAGRGTDIQLGGNVSMRLTQEAVGITDEAALKEQEAKIRDEIANFKKIALDAGGLYIIGTERHESRRIDNQLRGRSGRQGDPGRSKFFLSLQDDLMRIFGSERMDSMLVRLGLKEDESITHPWINKAIEKAQQKVEARNFETRKNILKYDDVMNYQRKVIFEQRRDIMAMESLEDFIADMRQGVIDDIVDKYIPANSLPESWQIADLQKALGASFNSDFDIATVCANQNVTEDEIRVYLTAEAEKLYHARVEKNTPDIMRYLEKQVILQAIDHLWRAHLVTLDHLRQVIGWRGYAQRDPLNEYKQEAFTLFEAMMDELRQAVITQLMHVEVQFQAPPSSSAPQQEAPRSVGWQPSEPQVLSENKSDPVKPAPAQKPLANTGTKIGRNEPCPCGSGKKYKHCHGKIG